MNPAVSLSSQTASHVFARAESQMERREAVLRAETTGDGFDLGRGPSLARSQMRMDASLINAS